MAARNYVSFRDGPRLTNGTHLNYLFNGTMSFIATLLAGTTVTGATLTTPTVAGLVTETPQLLTAAGATQGGATAITSTNAIITVSTTASTHGVKLPTASTGLVVSVGNLGTFGVKVYPATNGKIGAASTNAADTVLAINKSNQYRAVNRTLWVVNRGA